MFNSCPRLLRNQLPALLGLTLVTQVAFSEPPEPVILAIDAAFGVQASTSAQAIELGARIAASEINSAGGVLNGRPLRIEIRNNNSMPARAAVNMEELAENPNVVAVMTGKYSPVLLQTLPLIHELKLPVLDPWAAADGITNHSHRPNYVFRLSLTDSWAMKTIVNHAQKNGYNRLGVLVPHSGWGRSSLEAISEELAERSGMRLVGKQWYNFGDTDYTHQYQALLDADAEVLILVANELEGAAVVNMIAGLEAAERLPVLSHWGVTGGTFFELSSDALQVVDFSVVQTYSFISATDPIAQRVIQQAIKELSATSVRDIESPVGVAHAYDLTHLLAKAIELAGTTSRTQVRQALEELPAHQGLVRYYSEPFNATRHDALTESTPFMAKYAEDGAIIPMD